MAVRYTRHALEKFELLAQHGFPITRQQVEGTVLHPERVESQSADRYMAQTAITPRHLLRVIYRIEGSDQVVITFYPGRRQRYEGPI
jgi:hypothetical protein